MPPPSSDSSLVPDSAPRAEKKRNFLSRLRRAPEPSSDASSTSSASDASSTSSTPAVPPVGFFHLFRFTTRKEKLLIILSVLAAIVHGSLFPIWTIFFGDIIQDFGDTSIDSSELMKSIGGTSKWLLVLGCVAFVSSFIQVRGLLLVASQTSIRIRKLYFQSLMRQDCEWYDGENSGELTARVAGDVDLIQAGIGDTVGSACQFLATSLVGFAVSFIYTWKLTLAILAVTPALAICGGIFAKMTAESAGDGQGAYGSAGAIASEVISLIRTVHAFGGVEEEALRYEAKLKSAYKSGVKKGFADGAGLGMTMFLVFSAYGFSFWFGAKLVRDGEIAVRDVFVAFYCVMMGSMSIGQAAPSFTAISTARGAAPRVFEIIDRASAVDPLPEEGSGGVIPSGDVGGGLSFKNVTFNYASRAEKGGEPVLRGLNLEIAAGTTHAWCGVSGCGKTTAMSVIERFYDPQEGSIELGGIDISTLNVSWLRSQMGYVGQMPTLFRASIRDNIAYGAAVEYADGKMTRDEMSDDQIIAAAKLANAHDFIMTLPEKYDTQLGDRGALLSGGQKQRVCIARAVVRNPKLLLLDESTSALDSRSERIVQEALERAAAGRTTIIIAHRLSTVRNADVISVFESGVIAESGTHDDLIQKPDGIYRDLVQMQQVAAQKRNESELEEAIGDDGVGVDAPADSADKSTAVDSIDVGVVTKDGKLAGEEESADGSEKPDFGDGIIRRAFGLNKSEWPFMLLGCIGGALAGASWPITALAFSEVTVLLADPTKKGEIVFWACMFVAIGAVSLTGNVLHMGMLGISGERMTFKIRKAAFRAILKQDMAFFDEEQHSLGSLTTRLATEASYVKGLCGDTLGMVAVVVSTITTGVVVSFVGCWRLAFVVLAMLPIFIFGFYIQMKTMTGFDAHSKKDFVRAGSYASEAVDNIRTVTSLGVQDKFIDRYAGALEAPENNERKGSLVSGISFGFGEFFMFVMWAVAFWTGSRFIEQGSCDFLGVMKAITGLLFAGMTVGNVSTFAPSIAASKVAATKIFRLVDRDSAIDPTSSHGRTLSSVVGSIDVKDAKFEYPTRPDVPVLRGLEMSLDPGKTIALVGSSGSGKSTMIQILMRFYDLRSGSANLDGNDIRELNLQSARSHMALVQQEPDLFDRTIKANIAYGLAKDGATPVSDDVIVTAAKAANAHNFISELPQGYDTPVGERGAAMSGGMKQRIAIARALVRQPTFLWLDEATSALDVQSEMVVQEALDAARLGRTTVVVAHRLSTVKDADSIAVLARGKIVECGTHSELMAKKGAYSKLVYHQTTQGGAAST